MVSYTKCLLVVATLTIILMLMSQNHECAAKRLNEVDVSLYREKVKKMFYHAYEGYLNYAYPYDELQPLTCKGFDTWGSYSLTLIDALDTLAVIGNNTEFRRVANIVIDKGENIFDMDINVSVFETNIRIVGGLLSAHLLMKRTGMQLEPAWPCSGPLLRMAESIARRLLPAFDTPTGMPYGTVNLRFGVPKGETPITCTAGVGTFIVEFGTLSRLTGDPIFEKTAIRAIRSLWKFRSPIGLLGNHIDVKTGKWTALDSGIGGGVDSYFEYLVKGSILFNLPELVHLFRDYEEPIKKYLKRDDWYMWAHMTKGSITLPMFTSLDAFWPGIQTLIGDIEPAMKTLHNFQQVWRQFGSTPEYYNIPKAEAHKGREGYPLRPELIESIVYLYQATKDPVLLEMGVDIVEAIERTARTSCGYATVKDVRDHRLEDRMESFFLAETAKYLYLLFDTENFIHNNGSHGTHITTPSGSCVIEAGGYVFNTEAHPIDLASIYCCSAEKQEEDRKLDAFHSNLDLLTLMGLVEDVNELADANWSNRRRKGRGDIAEEDEDLDGGVDDDDDELDYGTEEGMLRDLLEPKPLSDMGEGKIAAEEKLDEPEMKEEDLTISHHGEKYLEEGHMKTGETRDDYSQDDKLFQGIDLGGLSEMEKGVAKILLEQLSGDSDMTDASLKISQEIETNFKGTEFEKVAEYISTQLKSEREKHEIDMPGTFIPDEISDPMTRKDDDQKMEKGDLGEVTPTSASGEEIIANSAEKEDGSDKNIDKHTEEISKKLKEMLEKLEIDGESKSHVGQQVVILSKDALSKDADEKQGTNQGMAEAEGKNAQEQQQLSTANLNPALQKLKDHLEAQLLQQYKLSSMKDEGKKDVKASSLENKRANLLSLTTKVFKLISQGLTGGGGGDTEDEDSGQGSKPSLAGLYRSLSEYPLQYFHDPRMMHCPAQPFHSRLAVYGEMAEEE